jgi:hypothetical protein
MELGTITWAGPASSLDVEQLSAVYLGGGRTASVTAPEGPPSSDAASPH